MILPDDPIMLGHQCPYCNKPTEYIDSVEVYCKSYGMMYICRKCKAWVGVHKGTNQALGRVAKKSLRQWKIRAHESFDKIWTTKRLTRENAYYWLSIQMGIPRENTHMGMFDEQQCKMVVRLCEKALNNKK